MRRIYISGLTGSGKSTLARELGQVTGIPVIHSDTMLRRDGDRRRPYQEQIERLTEIIATESWILDGTLPETREFVLANAECFILIEIPHSKRRWNLVKRAWTQLFADPDDIPNTKTRPWRVAFYIGLFRNHDPQTLFGNQLMETAHHSLVKYRICDADHRQRLIRDSTPDR